FAAMARPGGEEARRPPPGDARSARVRGDYTPGIGQLAPPFVPPCISSRVYINNQMPCSAMNAVHKSVYQNSVYIVQNSGAIMAGASSQCRATKPADYRPFSPKTQTRIPGSNATGLAIAASYTQLRPRKGAKLASFEMQLPRMKGERLP